MIHRICFLLLLILIIIICSLNNINEPFVNNLNAIDKDQYNKMQQISNKNKVINKEIKGEVNNSINDLNIKLKKTQNDFVKDKEAQSKMLKQCAAEIDPTTSFNKIPKKTCKNRYILGKTFTSIAGCANNCENNKDCLSFSHNDKNDECRLTASCYDLNSTPNNDFDTYVKKNAKLDDYPLTKFNMFLKRKCKLSDDMESSLPNMSVIDCAKKCNNDNKCISYHFKKNANNDSGTCNLSQKCFMGGCTSNDPSYTLFTKYHFNLKQINYRQCDKCPIIASPISIRIKSAGLNSRDRNRGVWIDNKKIATAGRSYNLLVVELTGLKGVIAHKKVIPKIIFNRNYDVYGNRNSARAMSLDMDRYNKNGYLLIVHTYDEPFTNRNYITSLWNGKYNNLDLFHNISIHNAYGLIFQNGKGILEERLSMNNIDFTYNFKYEII
jgi:hypothetical protein